MTMCFKNNRSNSNKKRHNRTRKTTATTLVKSCKPNNEQKLKRSHNRNKLVACSISFRARAPKNCHHNSGENQE